MVIELQYVSIFVELLIAILSMLIFLKKKKIYGLGFFITFGIYVFYDISKLINLNVSDWVLYGSFFIASISALFAIIKLYMEKRK